MNMKRILFFVTIVFGLTSCGDGSVEVTPPGQTTQIYVDASDADTWHYLSLSTGEVVGTSTGDDENAAGDNAEWRARTDWDIAIQRYKVRTRGGVLIPDEGRRDQFGNYPDGGDPRRTSFESILGLTPGVVFTPDAPVVEEGMAGVGVGGVFTTVVMSKAVVVQMWKNSVDGPPVMPPDYRIAPVYIFRSGDGGAYYKVEFTEYKNDQNAAGHVRFRSARIYPVE